MERGDHRDLTRVETTLIGTSADSILKFVMDGAILASETQNASKESQVNINIESEKAFIRPSQFCDVVSFSRNTETLLCF